MRLKRNRPRDPGSGRRALSPAAVFWVAFLSFTALTSTWALSNPLMASPDEPSHLVKAVATVYGQVANDKILIDREARVPEIYADVRDLTCVAFDPDAPQAKCGNGNILTRESPDGWVTVDTPAGRYNPFYYALVGWPSRLSHDLDSIYLMRVLSGALGSFFLALGMRALRQARVPAWSLAAAMTGLTPTVPFLCASVNPQSLELSAAFALWCQVLVLLRATPPEAVGRRMWLLSFIASCFANSRGLSPLFMALIAVSAIALQPWARTWAVLRNRQSWAPFGVMVLTGGAACAWILSTGVLGTELDPPDPPLSFTWMAVYTMKATDAWLLQIIGNFGWVHLELPMWMVIIFSAGFVATMVLTHLLGTWRERVVVLGSGVLLCIGVPVYLHASQASTLGIIWQGRYILPLVVGIPVLAAFVLAERMSLPEDLGRRALRMWWLAFVTVHCGGVIVNLHRYISGSRGPWIVPDHAWLPPVPLWSVDLGLVVFAALLYLLMARMPEAAGTTGTHPDGGDDTDGGDDRDDPEETATSSQAARDEVTESAQDTNPEDAEDTAEEPAGTEAVGDPQRP